MIFLPCVMPSAKPVLTFADMLHEIAAEAFVYDAATDTLRVTATGARGSGKIGLLDAKGFLVGLDLRDDLGRGSIVMVGPHEAVAEQKSVDVRLEGDGVVITGAAASVRGAEKSPYR